MDARVGDREITPRIGKPVEVQALWLNGLATAATWGTAASAAPEEPGFAPHYRGGVAERDGSYHQGTVWPWLMGPFVEAYLRVHGDGPEGKRAARERFLFPLRRHLGEAGLGHVSEVADALAPHLPGGAPFQAWSLGELLRLERVILQTSSSSTSSSTSTTTNSSGTRDRHFVTSGADGRS